MSSQPGRKRKRFLAPQEKYEIWMQLVRGETSIADAAESARVDRSTIAKLRVVARDGALDALARSRPGARDKQRDLELEAVRREAERLRMALAKGEGAGNSIVSVGAGCRGSVGVAG